MSERPTPETDARTYIPSLGASTVPAEFARKLERDEAREHLSASKHFLEKYIAERDEAREKLKRITFAAQAVVDRWEQPSWKDAEPTAAVIYRLRDALEEAAK
jgi:N-glycosylase/DNA lyase